MTAPRLPTNAPPQLIILDFDGVVADSELLSNTLLAEFLSKEGLPTTVEQAMARYMGRRWPDNQIRIREHFGRPLPDDFFQRYHNYENGLMRREVQPVAGVTQLLEANPERHFCIASSSSVNWLDHGVDKFGLRSHLGRNLFSGTEVANGKPAPDIFLLAASRMGVEPRQCSVIEDSPAGVQGAVAAGMTVIGFLGGAHVRDGHGDRLVTAGAHALARNYGEVADLLGLRRPAVD